MLPVRVLYEIYSSHLEGTTACEDETVRPRVSVSSEGFVLEGHESDPKVVLYQRLLELTTRLYPGPVQKGLG